MTMSIKHTASPITKYQNIYDFIPGNPLTIWTGYIITVYEHAIIFMIFQN